MTAHLQLEKLKQDVNKINEISDNKQEYMKKMIDGVKTQI